MLAELIAKNIGTFRVIAAHAPNDFNKAKPILRWAVPAGGFLVWAAWPSAGPTVKGAIFGNNDAK